MDAILRAACCSPDSTAYDILACMTEYATARSICTQSIVSDDVLKEVIVGSGNLSGWIFHVFLRRSASLCSWLLARMEPPFSPFLTSLVVTQADFDVAEKLRILDARDVKLPDPSASLSYLLFNIRFDVPIRVSILLDRGAVPSGFAMRKGTQHNDPIVRAQFVALSLAPVVQLLSVPPRVQWRMWTEVTWLWTDMTY